MKYIVESSQKFKLDFDDAYQYSTSEKYDLIIVSFDKDFDRTQRGRIQPA
ncbi:MAG: PIN domain-containing protein [Bacteroidetes bacterium]|nr:PIN domain-containing protein [Bacteroidota bacterium]MBU1423453.1 PIN domain-containing protein [Bacteroidota bacterium]MBU2471540.1 PIN domain-containing protein [Bacteroidota bacterium]MBU2635816.1 PIN domain-containing protein [Bacteroidota bacterium]